MWRGKRNGVSLKNKSFLIAFPGLRTQQEFEFIENVCDLVSRSGYDLEVISALQNDLPLLQALSPRNIIHQDHKTGAEGLLRRLLRTPEKALIFNDLMPARFELRSLLVQQGVKTKIIERSPCADFIWVEDDIFFGGSKLFGFSPNVVTDYNSSHNLGGEMLSALSSNVAASRRFEVTNALRQNEVSGGVTSGRGYLLFLLDAIKHSGWGNQNCGQPWTDLYPHFPNPAEALSVFSAFASAKGLDFVVKTHPSDPAPRFIPDIKAFQPATGSLESLLVGATAVVSGMSKTLWAAAALGKPFASLALNPIQGLIDDHLAIADANLLLERFAAHLERGYTIEMDVLRRGLQFASDFVWVRSDFSNTAASDLADWVSMGQESMQSPAGNENVWPDFSKEERLTVDESLVALEWVKFKHDTERPQRNKSGRLVAVDVGAHVGHVTRRARALGFQVVAFEPNPKMAQKFQSAHGEDEGVLLSRAALSSGAEEVRAFYTSKVSTGISTLEPFHESHLESNRVFTTSLRTFLPKWGIDDIDVLKVDTEGFDLFVLQGHDWEKIKPRVVVCEFENAKTEPLGYGSEDLAQFLVNRGYSVFVSEWFPITAYGGNHLWRTLYPYGSRAMTDSSWGNFIAFHGEVHSFEVQHHFYSFVSPRTLGSAAAPRSLFDQLKTGLRVKMPTIYTFLKTVFQKIRFRLSGRV